MTGEHNANSGGNHGVADDLKALHIAFKEAEDACKTAETLRSAVFTGAINELRYAGRHLLDAMLTNDLGKREMHMSQAKSHCQRANYDASDAAIAFLVENIMHFGKQYPHADVRAVVSDYPDMRAVAHKVRKEAANARIESRSEGGGGPSHFHSSLKSHIEELEGYWNKLEANRSAIADNEQQSSAQLKQGQDQLRWTKWRVILVAIGILSSMLTAAFMTLIL